MLGIGWELLGLLLSFQNRVHKAEKGSKRLVPVVLQIYKVYKSVHVGAVFVKIIIRQLSPLFLPTVYLNR